MSPSDPPAGPPAGGLRMSGASPRVTTVIMTRDRWPDLRRSLAQHERPVILVDNGSSDGTPELVAEHFPHIEVVALGGNLGAVARNVGVERARTPYVAFADDDSWWAPGSLTKAADVLDAHPRLALLAARVLVGPEERPDPVVRAMTDSPLTLQPGAAGPPVLGFLACGAVVHREAFLEVGGFDDVVFFFGEEERLALDLAAAGWELSYVGSVVAHHHPSPARQTLDRQARAVRNRFLTAVLRRPWPVVARAVLDDLRHQGRAARLGLRRALPALPQALRRRKLLPARVEASKRLLEQAHAAGPPPR